MQWNREGILGSMRKIIVGTRESQLAQTQTGQVIEQLRQLCVQHGIACQFETRTILTKGDQILDVTLSKVGGKGLFVKEIEQALLNGEIDLAVHSMKDMPFELPEGLTIGAIPIREDMRDALISRNDVSLEQLPQGALVGTSSLRREAQLRKLRPDLHIKPLRGNIDTRLRKLETEGFDAIILAAAGLRRMGWQDRISEYIGVEQFVPAVGQGALAIQCREDDEFLLDLLSQLQHEETAVAVRAERAFLGAIEGSCQVPIGAYATWVQKADGKELTLTAIVGDPEGKQLLRITDNDTDPEALGRRVAQVMLDNGADAILRALKE